MKAEVDYREHDVVHSLGHDDELFDRTASRAGQDPRGVHRRAARDRREVRARPVHPRRDRGRREVRSATPSSPSTWSGRRRATTWRRRSSPTRSCRRATSPSLVADVRRNKALAAVLESASITDASGNTVDLSVLPAAQLADPDPDSDGTDGTLGLRGAGRIQRNGRTGARAEQRSHALSENAADVGESSARSASLGSNDSPTDTSEERSAP